MKSRIEDIYIVAEIQMQVPCLYFYNHMLVCLCCAQTNVVLNNNIYIFFIIINGKAIGLQ